MARSANEEKKKKIHAYVLSEDFTLPAEGIGYIPATGGHREGFGDYAKCH